MAGSCLFLDWASDSQQWPFNKASFLHSVTCWASSLKTGGNKASIRHPKWLLLLCLPHSWKWYHSPNMIVCVQTGAYLECSPTIQGCLLTSKLNPSAVSLLRGFHPGPGCHLCPGPLLHTPWLFLLLHYIFSCIFDLASRIHTWECSCVYTRSWINVTSLLKTFQWFHIVLKIESRFLSCGLRGDTRWVDIISFPSSSCFILQHSLFMLLHLPENLSA